MDAKPMKICQYWQKHQCTNGDKCTQKHDGPGGTLSPPPKPQQMICIYFQQGYCKYNDKCVNKHEAQNLKLTPLKPAAIPVSPPKACIYFQKNFCRNGSQCPNKHDTDAKCIYWEKGQCYRRNCVFKHDGPGGLTTPPTTPTDGMLLCGECNNSPALDDLLICVHCKHKKRLERKIAKSLDDKPKCALCIDCNNVPPRARHARCKECSQIHQQKVVLQLDPPKYWKHKAPKATGAKLSDAPDAKPFVQALFNHSNVIHRIGLGKDVKARWKQAGSDKYTHTAFNVTKVTRIENRLVWTKYATFRSEVALLNVPMKVSLLQEVQPTSNEFQLEPGYNEVWLLHGFPSMDKVHHIINKGWNEKYCPFENGILGGMFGQATYFADSITKVDQYIDPNVKIGYCIMSRVCLGNIYITKVDMKSTRMPPDGHHSIVCLKGPDSALTHFSEFMVYDGHHAYPEYLIEFERVGKQAPPDQRDPKLSQKNNNPKKP